MNGLSAEAAARLAHVGPNALPEWCPDPLWLRFVRQFNSPLIFILLFALAFDSGLWVYEGAHGWPIEASAIVVVFVGAFMAWGACEVIAHLVWRSGEAGISR